MFLICVHTTQESICMPFITLSSMSGNSWVVLTLACACLIAGLMLCFEGRLPPVFICALWSICTFLRYKSVFFDPHFRKCLDFCLFQSVGSPWRRELAEAVCFCTWVLPFSETFFKKGRVCWEVFLIITKKAFSWKAEDGACSCPDLLLLARSRQCRRVGVAAVPCWEWECWLQGLSHLVWQRWGSGQPRQGSGDGAVGALSLGLSPAWAGSCPSSCPMYTCHSACSGSSVLQTPSFFLPSGSVKGWQLGVSPPSVEDLRSAVTSSHSCSG